MGKLIKLPFDLLIILIWVISTVIFVVTPSIEDSLIRKVLGIPMVLIIPGYVLIYSFFPRKDDLEPIERITLSIGTSIAIVSLIGLGLNYTSFGIRLLPILISLFVFTICLIIIGLYKRNSIEEIERFSIPFLDIINIKMSKIDIILTIILTISIIGAIGMLIYVMAVPKMGEKFTEFYILNSSEKADNYSTNLRFDEYGTYILGVVNHEYTKVNYTIMVEIGEDVLFSENLTLKNNQIWEDNLTFRPIKKLNEMKLEFLLYKENNFTDPYRELHLWISKNN